MSDWMPPIAAYMALAEAMHEESDICNGNGRELFADCGAREADIEDAVKVLVALHRADWQLVRRPEGAAPLLEATE